MLLRNQELYQELLLVDVAKNERVRRFQNPSDTTKTNGIFFEHENCLYGLGASNSKLFLIAGDKLIAHDQSWSAQLVESNNENKFSIHHGNTLVLEILYRPIYSSGYIANEDDECLDGFRWIHAVLTTPERQAKLIQMSKRDG